MERGRRSVMHGTRTFFIKGGLSTVSWKHNALETAFQSTIDQSRT
jgi:hypothetical protein